MPFQSLSVPQPGEKTPTAIEYAPVAAEGGTGHELEYVRVWPAVSVWLSQNCWKT